jgi:hypothetical protein
VHGKSAFAERVQGLLDESGFHSSRLLSLEGGDEGESAVFEIDGLIIRAIRDRAQEFLDVGTTDHPDELHQFDDIAVALGWSTIESMLLRTEPEPLSSVIKQVREHFDAMRQLAGPMGEFTRARIQRASAARAAALEKKLR